MKTLSSPRFFCCAALLIPGPFVAASRADVTPAALFQDHAVLQAGKPLPVWGQAAAGEKVSVTFAGQNVSTMTGADGAWRVTLAPLKVNAQPATLTITGKNTLTVNDVLVGEVWLCSGQSNMEFVVNKAANAEAEMAAANFPAIRHLRVRNQAANDPAPAFKANWSVCTPANVGSFTAVGYFFARELHQKLGGVPVGIIHSSWGGTDIEAWMDAESIARNPNAKLIADHWQKVLADYPAAQAKHEALVAEDNRKAEEAKARNEPFKKPWRNAPPNPDGSPNMNKPANLFNGMIHPLAPAALAGVLWYQGENNADRANEYRPLLPALITGWRTAFGQGNLPFYWVQLPNYGNNSGTNWAVLREAQTAALVLPATAQAITIDVGEAANIHPLNKQDVGHRLALLALHGTYRQNVVAAGPGFAGATFGNGAARVMFIEPGGSALVVKGPAITGFEVAGADRVFKPAAARLEGHAITARAAEVPAPVAVRYAWRNAPEASLFNKDGLPAAPFRSDGW